MGDLSNKSALVFVDNSWSQPEFHPLNGQYVAEGVEMTEPLRPAVTYPQPHLSVHRKSFDISLIANPVTHDEKQFNKLEKGNASYRCGDLTIEQNLTSTEMKSTVEDEDLIGISDTLKQKLGRLFNRFRYEKEIREISEESLRQSENKYRTLFKNSKDGVYITSEDGKLIDFNDALLDLIGYTKDEISGFQIGDHYVNPSDREIFKQNIKKSGYVKDYEVKLKKKDGSILNCLLTTTLQPSGNGKPCTYQGVMRDISKVRKLEKRRLEFEKMKDDFIVLNAHELGTPLMVIGGYMDIIKDDITKMNDDTKDAILHIENNLKRIQELQKAMYNIALLAHDKFRIHPRPFLISYIIEQAIKEMKISADRKLISIVNRITDIPLVVADEERIRKVIMILLDNGIKYTPEGGHIEISAKNQDDCIEIIVEDNGIGIHKTENEKIFVEFYQIQDIMGHKDGFGLGLSISKGIIEAHGGKIWVESTPLKGTKFHFTIPKRQVAESR